MAVIFASIFMLVGNLSWIKAQDVKTQELGLRIMFSVFGLACAGGGVLHWRYENKLRLACTAQAAGIVKEIQKQTKRSKRRTSTSYYPVFTYSAEGKQYVRGSSNGYDEFKFSVGDNVTVFHDPSNPKRYYVLEEGRSTVMNIFLIAFGAVFLIIAQIATIQQ